MKSRRMKAFLLLGLLLLSLVFSGCTPEQGTTAPTQNTAPTEPTQLVSKYNNPMNLPDEMIGIFLKHLWLSFSPGRPSMDYFEKHLNVLKLSEDPDNFYMARALCATIDPENYYFVCGYYDTHHENERRSYCCKSQYLWMRFDKAEDIPEMVNGQALIAAFQINDTLDCRNVMPATGSDPLLNYFQMYTPEFADGYNVADPLWCDQTVVFWNRPPKKYISDLFMHIVPSVVLEGTCYLTVKMYTDGPNGERITHSTEEICGKYYDALRPVLITGQYTEIDEDGNVIHYGLLRLEDVARILATWEE